MEISEREFVSQCTGTCGGFKNIWCVVLTFSYPVPSEPSLTQNLLVWTVFRISVFLKDPLWLLFAEFSREDLFLVRCVTSGNIVSCSSPFSKSYWAVVVVGLLSLYETWLNKYEVRQKIRCSLTVKSVVGVNKRQCLYTLFWNGQPSRNWSIGVHRVKTLIDKLKTLAKPYRWIWPAGCQVDHSDRSWLSAE